MTIVRLAEAADEPALQVLCAIQPAGAASVYAPHSLRGRGRLYDAHNCWVAEAQGRIVGATLCALKPVELHSSPLALGHIFNLRVAPEARGTGVGVKLCRQAELWTQHHHGAAGTYAFVGTANLVAFRLFSGLGYVVRGRAAYRIAPALRDGPPVAAEWNVTAPDLPDLSAYDWSPADLRQAIYTAGGTGGFLGQVRLSNEAGQVSVWDKDRRIGREPHNDDERTVFLFDLKARDGESARELIRAVSDRFAWVGKLIIFMDAKQEEGAMLEGLAPLDREEFVMLRTCEAEKCNPQMLYYDVRD